MEAQNNYIARKGLIDQRSKYPVGIAADQAGFTYKTQLIAELKAQGYIVADFGTYKFVNGYNYLNFVVPLAMSVAKRVVLRGVAISHNGVGAGIAANKIVGVRAALITENFSAQHGVEDMDMNLMCLDLRVSPTYEQCRALVRTFLDTNFKEEGQFSPYLSRLSEMEQHDVPKIG